MARRVTDKDIREMFEAYALCGTYNGVAAATGWSVSTVRKYLSMEKPSGEVVTSSSNLNIKIEIPPIEDIVRSLTGKQKLSALSPEEKKGVREIQKGMII